MMLRALLVLELLVACGPTSTGFPDGGGGGGGADGPGAPDAPPEPVCDPELDDTCNARCAAAAAQNSYLGCEYFPVDLDNNLDLFGEPIPGNGCSIYASTLSGVTWTEASFDVCVPGSGQAGNGGLCDPGGDCSLAGGGTCQPMVLCAVDAGHSPYAVVVSNPDPDDEVEVTLHGPGGELHTVAVDPGAVAVLKPQELGFADRSLEGSELAAKAYRLTATHPIVAYQFNPLDHAGVFSNDASLLLPTHTHDVEYWAFSWPTQTRRPYRHDSNSFVAVVASAPGTTSVTVTPTAGIRAGSGVAAGAAGVPATFTLQHGEVLNLEAVASGDLTGTHVVADKPVAVYSGHEATTLAETAPAPCCMDHLEDQLFPASAWGKRYAVARFVARGAGERDIVRIMAQKPNTTVTLSPPLGSCPLLQPGQWCQIAIDAPIEITATEPIQVAHYMTSIGGTTENSADPALAFAVPIEQYRRDYTVLVPDEYFHNYFALLAETGAAVAVDGTPVPTTPFGSGALASATIEVGPGQHTITCPDGCGIEIYGWADAVSYLFAGGLDVNQIVVE